MNKKYKKIKQKRLTKLKQIKKIKKIKKVKKIIKKTKKTHKKIIKKVIPKKVSEANLKKVTLLVKGKERGFITFDEILKEFPTIEDDVFMLETVYEECAFA